MVWSFGSGVGLSNSIRIWKCGWFSCTYLVRDPGWFMLPFIKDEFEILTSRPNQSNFVPYSHHSYVSVENLRYIYRITSGDSRTFFNGNYVCHKQRRISLKLEHLSFKYLQLIAWDGKCVYYQQSSIFPLDSYWNKYMHLPLFSLHITKLTIMNMYFVHETEWYDKTHWSSPF